MNKRNLGIILLILCVLISATLFVSPVNRGELGRESGSSGIQDWEYLASEHKLSEEASLGFESVKDSDAAWIGFSQLDNAMALDAEVFWLRGKLPENLSAYSPVLFLEFDFPVEVYVQGVRIYSYGTMKDRDRVLPFQHMVPIRDVDKGQWVYFKYPAKEGLAVGDLKHLTAWDMVSKDEKSKALIDYEIIPLILSIIGAFIGLCLIFIAALQRGRQREEAGLLAFAGLFDLLTSINILSYLYIVRINVNQPVLIFYTDYISYFLIPYAAGSFIDRLLKSRPKVQMSTINNVFLAYAAVVILLSRIPGFDISRADYVFNASFLAYAVYMVCLLVKELRSGHNELRIMTVGLVIAGATGVSDILRQLYVFDYPGVVSCYGMFVLTICLVCYFGLRYSNLYNDAKITNIKLIKSKEMIEQINRDLDRKVFEKTSAIRSLFDNAEQGFLSFKEDLRVENEYSFKCCEIFGGDIAGYSLPELLSNGSKEQEKFIRTLLQRVFSLQEEGRRGVYFSLLPTELSVNGKTINIDYKLIDKHREESKLTCMVILTDITEKHMLEAKLEQERSILKMGVKVVANHTDFVNIVCDYKDFCEIRIQELMSSPLDTGSKYAEVFRAVHTFKGTFAQFDMMHITKRLHDFETTIDHFMRIGHGFDNLKGLFVTNDLGSWLEEDFAILRGVLGDRYLKLDKLVVAEEAKLKDIEGRILARFEGEDAMALVRELRKLRYKPIKEMLGHYPQYCMRLSERLEKPIDDFEIMGADIAVDPDIYSGLCKAMVHIFRNVMDHGIEAAEERICRGKSELGSVSCHTDFDGGMIRISISDDGAGIDIETIRQTAVENGIMSLEEAAAASEEEIIQVLYTDGFTTADEVTELSGRGVGLPAVKAEVEKLKGKMEIVSEKGKGTSFYITVPLLD